MQNENCGNVGKCKYCGSTIYWLQRGRRSVPFESWVAGCANVGEMTFHDCSSRKPPSRRNSPRFW